MTGEPSAKRQRTEEPAPEELERVQKVLEQVEEVNAELEAADAALAKEVLAIERKFNKTKAPTFAKRNALLAQVPGLWKQALSNHPLLAASIDEQDELILEHATSLDVEFLEDNNGSYKLALTLKENPFLANKTVWKQIVFSEDDEGEDQVTASGLEWKDTDEAKEAKEGASFLSWLASAEGDHELAEFIKDEVWKHPVQLYLSRDSDDEDDDEEGEGEDGDEEEGDEEEEEAAEE